MGFFDIFKRNKKSEEEYNNDEVNEELEEKNEGEDSDDARINKIWDLWSEDKLSSPVSDLMLYQAEVNNGGHDQFFFNLENRIEEDAFETTISALRSLLKGGLIKNFETALSAYRSYDDDEDKACEILEKCDDYYYENEDKINQILEKLWDEVDV